MSSQQERKRTIYVGGLGEGGVCDPAVLLRHFAPFGEIVDVVTPKQEGANRGFGFITFSTVEEAMDAIDNMHLNEVEGRIINVNIARAPKASAAGGVNRPIWEDEEWIKENAAPLPGGVPDAAAPELNAEA
ncbi:Cyclophilin-type peptidyl-prolyl cis-trans isomerase [Ceraceosorus bombacis]|uniref:Cyclophilin-type peptidyl-prolyl cis-trans isomerase n=1 Tax=Ceraceosorus bombacis TaxID=401625 RepID=A0A0P1BRE9_9BASI|nr:Cyclophilin-type peptidyl-prolyl cis-trans isomerase [Ceraceosorus bombacis]